MVSQFSHPVPRPVPLQAAKSFDVSVAMPRNKSADQLTECLLRSPSWATVWAPVDSESQLQVQVPYIHPHIRIPHFRFKFKST